MEPEGSLKHTQATANCFYPEPARSNPTVPTSHFLKIHLNVYLPSTTEPSKWSLSLRFPHQNPACATTIHHTLYVLRQSHSCRFYQPNNCGRGEQIIKLLIMYFSPLPVTLTRLGPSILLSTLFSNTLSLPSSLSVGDQVQHLYNRQNYSSVYLNLYIFA
jgi:hypothetical protein